MAPKREPMVSTFETQQGGDQRRPATEISSAGQFGRSLRTSRMAAIAKIDSATVTGLTVRDRGPDRLQLRQRIGRIARERQPEQVAKLRDQDDDGDAGGEADRHRIGDVLDVGAEPQKADRQQHQSGDAAVASTRPS